jgi:hypothetical protein
MTSLAAAPAWPQTGDVADATQLRGQAEAAWAAYELLRIVGAADRMVPDTPSN